MTQAPERDAAPAGAPLRLLCDEMLAALARWLRAAGHDTALAARGEDDGSLIVRAVAEGRTIITRDTALAARVTAAVLLATDSLDAQAGALARSPGVDWMAAPFTRCLLDNASLRPATAAEAAGAPTGARLPVGPFRTCPHCLRLYWPGSHVRRMAARLERWASG